MLCPIIYSACCGTSITRQLSPRTYMQTSFFSSSINTWTVTRRATASIFFGNTIYNILPSEEAIAGFRSFDRFLIQRNPPTRIAFNVDLIWFYFFTPVSIGFPRSDGNISNWYAWYIKHLCTLHGRSGDGRSYVTAGRVAACTLFLLYPPDAAPILHIDLTVISHKMFNDGWEPQPKERHPLGDGAHN